MVFGAADGADGNDSMGIVVSTASATGGAGRSNHHTAAPPITMATAATAIRRGPTQRIQSTIADDEDS